MDRFMICVALTVRISIALGKPTEPYRPAPVEAKVTIINIENCFSRTNRPGIYRIGGNTLTEMSARFCLIQIEAPKGYRAEVVVDQTVHEICQIPNVKLLFDENTNGGSSKRHSMCSIASHDDFLKLKSVSSSSRISYSLPADQELLFSVRFIKKQLSCGDYVTADRVDEPIILTNQREGGARLSNPCRVFLPGGIHVHVDRLELGSDQQQQRRNGSYLRLRTGNDYRFLPFAANFYEKSEETDSIELPCKVGIVELHSNSSSLETATLRFTFAPHDRMALASANCA